MPTPTDQKVGGSSPLRARHHFRRSRRYSARCPGPGVLALRPAVERQCPLAVTGLRLFDANPVLDQDPGLNAAFGYVSVPNDQANAALSPASSSSRRPLRATGTKASAAAVEPQCMVYVVMDLVASEQCDGRLRATLREHGIEPGD